MNRGTDSSSRRSHQLNRSVLLLSIVTFLVMLLLAIHMADHLLRSGWSQQRLVEIVVLCTLGAGLFLSASKNYVGFGLLVSVNLLGVYLVPRGHFLSLGPENVTSIVNYWGGYTGIFFGSVVYALFIAIMVDLILAINAFVVRKRISRS